MKKAEFIKLFIIVPLAFVIYIPIVFVGQSADSSFQKGASLDKKAPEFSLEDAKGEKVNLKDLYGKLILLKFWTTWCPYCIKEIPKVNELYDDYSQKGLIILAIDTGESKIKVSSLIQKQKIKYRILFDLDGEVARKYNVQGVPTYVLIGKDGYLKYINNSRPEQILIEKLLQD